MMLSNNSDAPSIDCEAPCAKEGGKAKKASPTRWIFSTDLWKSLLTKTGKHLILFRLLKIEGEILFCNLFLIPSIKAFSSKRL